MRATDASPYTAYPLLLVCKQVLISSLKLRNQLHLVLWVYVRKTVELTTRQTLRYAICLMNDISYSYSSMITQSVTGLISCVIKSTNFTKRLKELETDHANQLAYSINNNDDTKRKFEATRALAAGDKQTEPISVFNAEEQLVGNDEEKAYIVRDWFLQHYTSSDSPLEPFTGPPRPLQTPITCGEVKYAASKLKNGNAVGPDQIPNELLKYAPDRFYEEYAALINQSFERSEHVPRGI